MMVQTIIAICGVASIWLSQSEFVGQRKFAPIIGLAAQPFWLYASLEASQYGIAALTIVYTIGWMRGLRTYWSRAGRAADGAR